MERSIREVVDIEDRQRSRIDWTDGLAGRITAFTGSMVLLAVGVVDACAMLILGRQAGGIVFAAMVGWGCADTGGVSGAIRGLDRATRTPRVTLANSGRRA